MRWPLRKAPPPSVAVNSSCSGGQRMTATTTWRAMARPMETHTNGYLRARAAAAALGGGVGAAWVCAAALAAVPHALVHEIGRPVKRVDQPGGLRPQRRDAAQGGALLLADERE